MILVDSSVWIAHLQSGEPHLAQLLGEQQVLVHEMVLGEVALGGQGQRQLAADLLPHLPMAALATYEEVMALVDQYSLYARGIGYVDVHLLAATKLSQGARLWTRDKRLQAASQLLGVEYPDLLH
jgi:predicted nucleic acid-binding protein